MRINYKHKLNSYQYRIGSGLVNNLINKLPIELHLPGYQFCGPGTKLAERLKRGDKGINPLDAACREHDIAYSQFKDLKNRHQADDILGDRAWERFKAKDSGLKERSAAWFVTNAMKTKVKFGLGMSKNKSHRRQRKRKPASNKKKQRRRHRQTRKKSFASIVSQTKRILKRRNPTSIDEAIQISQQSIPPSFHRRQRGQRGRRRGLANNISNIPRVIPLPKIGGFLPLIPILTALGAVGGLASGGSAVAKAINAVKNGKEQLAEATRHNRYMESIAMGKGLFLKPYKKGYGLFYKPYSPKN